MRPPPDVRDLRGGPHNRDKRRGRPFRPFPSIRRRRQPMFRHGEGPPMHALAPATNSWIETVCRRFSEATGWLLEYAPEPLAEGHGRNGHGWTAQDAWSATVNDGKRPAGRLRLVGPVDPLADRSWQAMGELAELLAELVNRATAAASELTSRTHEVATLIDIGMALAGESNLFRALGQLLRGAVELTGFHSSAFFLLNPATSRLSLRAWHGIDPQTVPFHHRALAADPPDLEALGRGRLWLARDVDEACDEWLPEHAATACCLVVQTAEGPMGTLWAFDRRRRIRREADLLVLGSIAAQVGAVLERLVLRMESAAGHRLRQDVRLASQYQSQAFEDGALPENLPFDVATLCASRYELGGDLCEVIPLSPAQTLLAVGDASGDSVPAAMLMAGVRGALRALVCGRAADAADTDALVAELNRTVCGMTPAHQFMSLWLGVIDTVAGTLTHTNAGHPSPVILRPQDAVERLASHGMLLGVMPESTYARSTVSLARGDVLIAFSDGVTEAMDAGRRLFGTNNVVRAARAAADESAAAILAAVRESVERHLAQGAQPDDCTLAVVRGAGPVSSG
ncbi:MAG TPA: PP2C family protein-serine/threonine phosphatase [Planctomycetaceae bacterium]|nr:PP2C family protein-serine/threonine phosphatase [Planctomycetaceae bacterium]